MLFPPSFLFIWFSILLNPSSSTLKHIHSFFHSSFYPFILSFILSFIHSFLYSPIHTFILFIFVINYFFKTITCSVCFGLGVICIEGKLLATSGCARHTCIFKLYASVYPLTQKSHAYGLTPVCVCMWRLRFWCCLNLQPQIEQEKGFSLSWTSMCAAKLAAVLNHFMHTIHFTLP